MPTSRSAPLLPDILVANGFPFVLELQHALLAALERKVQVRLLTGHVTPSYEGTPFPGAWSSARNLATDFVHSRVDPIVAAGAEVYHFAVPRLDGREAGLNTVLPEGETPRVAGGSLSGKIGAVGQAHSSGHNGGADTMMEAIKNAQAELLQSMETTGAEAASPTPGIDASAAGDAAAAPAHDHEQCLQERPRMFASGHMAESAMLARLQGFLSNDAPDDAAASGSVAGAAAAVASAALGAPSAEQDAGADAFAFLSDPEVQRRAAEHFGTAPEPDAGADAFAFLSDPELQRQIAEHFGTTSEPDAGANAAAFLSDPAVQRRVAEHLGLRSEDDPAAGGILANIRQAIQARLERRGAE